MNEFNYELLEDPPYLPDLDPLVYSLFRKSKQELRGKNKRSLFSHFFNGTKLEEISLFFSGYPRNWLAGHTAMQMRSRPHSTVLGCRFSGVLYNARVFMRQ